MDSKDFLIRSATSLLSIIDHQVEQPCSASDNRSVRFLDHIALLFVTEPKDVSAVSAVLSGNDSILVHCMESAVDALQDHTSPDYLQDSKHPRNQTLMNTTSDPLLVENPIFPPSVDAGYSTDMIGNAWLLNCCRRRGPMGSTEYVAQLQFLLSQLRNPQGPNAATNFTRCVYYHCYPKIMKRLCLPVSIESEVPFRQLFTPGAIDVEKLRARFNYATGPMNPKFVRHGDVWIKTIWKETYHTLHIFEEHDGDTYLVYDETAAIELHNLIGNVFRLMFLDLEKIEQARQIYTTRELVTPADVLQVEAALDGVAYYMNALAHLVKSPCVCTHLQHPVLQEWISTQHRRSYQTAETVWEADDDDVADAQNQASTDSTAAVTRWLRCASQWSVAISEITRPNTGTTRVLLSRGVQILSLKIPTVTEPRKQSSLDALLRHVAIRSPFHWKDAVKSLQVIASIKAAESGASPGWSRLTNGGWNEWQTSFTAKHHCESILASLLEMKSQDDVPEIVKIGKRAKKAIGVSRRCCLCCVLYLRALNPNLSFGACSGKAYPWALPPGCEESVGDQILDTLMIRLQQLLLGMGVPTVRSWDSGSDSERSDPDDGAADFEMPVPASFQSLE